MVAYIIGLFIANILGVTSEKITITIVIKIVATVIPNPPNSETSNSVIKAVARILNKLLARSMPVINSSLSSFTFKIKFAFLTPFSFCLCACSFETAVNAVSDPDERAERNSNTIIAINLIKINKVIN